MPGKAAAVQTPNATRGMAEDAGVCRGSSHALERRKQVVSMHHAAPKAEPTANECYAEDSGHGFAKFRARGTPAKHNTETRLGSHCPPSAARWNRGAGAGVSEPPVRYLPLDVEWFVRTGN